MLLLSKVGPYLRLDKRFLSRLLSALGYTNYYIYDLNGPGAGKKVKYPQKILHFLLDNRISFCYDMFKFKQQQNTIQSKGGERMEKRPYVSVQAFSKNKLVDSKQVWLPSYKKVSEMEMLGSVVLHMIRDSLQCSKSDYIVIEMTDEPKSQIC